MDDYSCGYSYGWVVCLWVGWCNRCTGSFFSEIITFLSNKLFRLAGCRHIDRSVI